MLRGEFQTGMTVSGVGHVGLLLWALIGGFFFARDTEIDFTVTDVAIISEADFAALQPQSPETGEAPDAPAPPEISEDAPALPSDQTIVAPEPAPALVLQPATDTEPNQIESPEPPGAPEIDTEAVPVPEAAPRVAPEATPEPEPNVQVDNNVQAETAPLPEAPAVQKEEQEATQPEEAATEIVTEAEEPSSAAPTKSARPTRKPPPPVSQVASEEQVEDIEEPAQPSVPGLEDLINNAVREANQPEQPAATADNVNPGEGSGPPITQSEKGAFILAIRQCWNVGSLSSEALRVTVVVGVSMARDGRPDVGSIRLLNGQGGSDQAIRQAFETARRAIIRCGASGYQLPSEKYAQWRDVEITFDPEKMRLR